MENPQQPNCEKHNKPVEVLLQETDKSAWRQCCIECLAGAAGSLHIIRSIKEVQAQANQFLRLESNNEETVSLCEALKAQVDDFCAEVHRISLNE